VICPAGLKVGGGTQLSITSIRPDEQKRGLREREECILSFIGEKECPIFLEREL